MNENILTYSGPAVTGNGQWGTPGLVKQQEEVLVYGTFLDELTQRSIATPQQKAIQQFWAIDFNMPSGFTLPGIADFPNPTIPLLILDGMSKAHKGLFGSLGMFTLAPTWESTTTMAMPRTNTMSLEAVA